MQQPHNHVILVNESDEWLGTMDKMQAHHEGVLHRAFSVFIVNSKNELLLHKRSDTKYHSGGLWTNTCCSHPWPGESTLAAAHRRLMEEMGFDCKLEPAFILRYMADVGNSMTENEYDHIYTGQYDGSINTDADEVSDYKYLSLDAISEWMQNEPEAFTAWFHLAFSKFTDHIQQQAAA